ncbi:YihY/virulence factor BrkB family protein [soil metagenome]
MARLKHMSLVLKRTGLLAFSKKVWFEVGNDNLFMLASSLAYAWLFAIFPFLIFLLSLLPYLPENLKEKAEWQVQHALSDNLPKKADVILDNIKSFMNQPKSSLLSVGLVITIWAASGGMSMTMAALDTAYDVENRRPFYKQKSVAILLTIVVATLILVVLALLPLGTIAANFAQAYGTGWFEKWGWDIRLLSPILIGWHIIRFSLSFLLLFLVLAILYHYGTAARTRFHLLSPGAVFCVVVWLLLGAVFRFYVDKFGKYEKTYGTVGGVAILLLFFYIDALVLLTGAEINSEIDNEVEAARLEDVHQNVTDATPNPT